MELSTLPGVVFPGFKLRSDFLGRFIVPLAISGPGWHILPQVSDAKLG